LNLLKARSVPLVDNLVIVSHGEQIPEFISCKRAQQLVLRTVCVLKLVNQPVWIRSVVPGGNCGISSYKAAGFEYQGIKVRAIDAPKLFFVEQIRCRGSFRIHQS